ncbi:hypothetical protein FHL15_007312 [Xylaria flabelliformis]|uniref:60S ribosome subunit biogenesis protein NIP7 n=1 Tax=Xylaria flabelliformis TaxID=2512241 RepID=A0A553HUY2_9PEZI|nr:hypothetical protein FHL15_007312 [Xylaria flabelliformis]
MRPLTEEETKILFEKLANYTTDLKPLIAPLSDSPDADRYVFRLIKDRVQTLKFRLHITALPILAAHARYKIWIKPNGVMPFLYGSHISKAHVGRWTEDCPSNVGVIVYDMSDSPIGFGVSARSTAEARRLDPTGIVVFRQADCGEYLRDEDTLFAG